MANPTFQRAERRKAKLRLGLVGPSGSGKSVTALRIASALGKKIAAIDSENESLSLYAPTGQDKGFCPQGFDTLNLHTFSPLAYVDAIHAAEKAGYDVIVIDSLTHAWAGVGGSLEQVDHATARSGGNKWAAWREVTPHHNALINAMIQSPCHIIATMRTKTEYIVEENERGKKMPKKIGLAPIQRDGMEYEFTLVGDMDLEHTLCITKTRCPIFDRAVIKTPGPEVGVKLLEWLDIGASNGTPAAATPAKANGTHTPPAAKSDPLKISAEQFGRIKEAAKRCGCSISNIVRYYGVERGSQIPASHFQDCLDKVMSCHPDFLAAIEPPKVAGDSSIDEPPQVPGLNKDQCSTLLASITKAGADLTKIMSYYSVENLRHVPAKEFADLMAKLNAKHGAFMPDVQRRGVTGHQEREPGSDDE